MGRTGFPAIDIVAIFPAVGKTGKWTSALVSAEGVDFARARFHATLIALPTRVHKVVPGGNVGDAVREGNARMVLMGDSWNLSGLWKIQPMMTRCCEKPVTTRCLCSAE